MKRKTALDLIMWDYAKHGKDSGNATRIYIENRISRQVYNEQAKKGFKIYTMNKEEQIEVVFNSLVYFDTNDVYKAKKTVEDVIAEVGLTDQRNIALTAFNKFLHDK